MIDGSLSLGEIKKLGAIRPEWALVADRILVSSYEDFINVLYRDLDQCIRKIEEDPDVRSSDGEDRLTAELIAMLCSRMYNASHDEKIGGHSDIVVRHPLGYLWLGEAKIHDDYAYLEKGFNQLTTRYSRGTPDADQGALIVYVRGANCAGVVTEWRKRLKELALPEFSDSDCSVRKELAFFSEHLHEGAGRKIRVRHVAVVQYFNPKDRKKGKDADATEAEGAASAPKSGSPRSKGRSRKAASSL